ncbi:SH3 domain-containing protein [Leptospira biflexa]|uniref:SH3 domain-containing protein n=1 Tax=Leptospira biflexa TaxID=172 RepID=UPI0010915B3B|nr:SH3 domain-containing protein [Leptospira biflexa]TGM55154.1 SH3 domain-containing protein [Leptospira biflexa]
MSGYKVSFFILVLCFISPLYSQNHWEDYIAEKNIGSTYPIFGDNVNLRDASNINGKVIKKLNLGSSVKVLTKTNQILEQNSVKEYWYKVQVGEEIGYLWGGLIADYSFPFKEYLVLCKNLGIKTRKLELKIIQDSKLLSHGSWEVGPMSNETWDHTIYESKQFSPSPNALFAIKFLIFSEIEYGYSNEQIFILNSENKISPQFSWNPGACDPPSCSETWLVFPKDTLPEDKKISRKLVKGKDNAIIEVMHSFDVEDPNQHDYYQTEYTWNGSLFQKKEK